MNETGHRNVTEQELIRQCRMRDPQAQRELYEQTAQRVFRLLLRMTRNEQDAFDLTQETYLKVFAEIDRFDGRSAIATWLYRIAVNQALQLLRRNKRSKVYAHESGLDPVDPTPIDRRDVQLDVGAALADLDPADRAMLLLRYQEGLDYREIAEIVGCAEGTVASRLNRSKQKLHGILEKSYALQEDSGRLRHPKVTEK